MAETVPAEVAPDLLFAVDLLPDFSNLGARLHEVRQLMHTPPPEFGSDGEVEVREIAIARGDGSTLRALLHLPEQRGAGLLPALLHVHGGGMVCGSADRDAASSRSTALELGCAVLTPDYRLAPEHPYPAPLDDVVLAWNWLAGGADGAGIDPARLILRGVSAGGGLAMGAAIRLRDTAGVQPRLVMLVTPMLDDRTGQQAHAGFLVWTVESNRFGWDSFLSGVDRDSPPAEAVPGRAEDLGGLPPVYIATGSIDLFAAENLEMARRLAGAGNAVECHLYPRAFHGFHAIESATAENFRAAANHAMRRAIADAPTGAST